MTDAPATTGPAADDPAADAPVTNGPAAVPRRSRWVIAALVGAVLLAVCCGGPTLWWASSIEKTDDPARVAQIAPGVMSARVPDRFEPAQATHFPTPPVVGWFVDAETDVVGYATRRGGQLSLCRLTGPREAPTARAAADGMTDGAVRAVTMVVTF